MNIYTQTGDVILANTKMIDSMVKASRLPLMVKFCTKVNGQWESLSIKAEEG